MIFFDIDQTLIDHQYAQDTAALLFLQQFSSLLPYSPEEFYNHWQALMERHFNTFTRGEITFIEHRRRRIRELFQEAEPCLTADEADERFAIYLQHYEENWTLFDDVLPCLNTLSNHKLGIISNGNTEQQTKKLCRTEILGRFDVVVISESIGLHKPSPEIFLTACHRSGVEVQQCKCVGDSLQNDVLAAEAVGIKGIWLNRKKLFHPQIPISVIQTLDELAAAI